MRSPGDVYSRPTFISGSLDKIGHGGCCRATSTRWLLAFAVLASVLLSPVAMATAQQPDKIVLAGKMEFLNTNPLTGWLKQNPGRLPKPDAVSSSNWRGYVATWDAHGENLLLQRIDVELRKPGSPPDSSDTERINVISTVFPGQQSVRADWYSGALVIPRGEVVTYVHMGYGSTYEKYLILRVGSGRITSRDEFSGQDFVKYRESKFRDYQQTPEYREALKELMTGEDPWDRSQADDFLAAFHAETYLSK